MIFFSLGLPGRLTEWCDAVLAHLASRLPGEVFLTTWPPLTKMLGYDEISPVLDRPAWRAIWANVALLYPASAMTAMAACTICARRAVSVKVRAGGRDAARMSKY